MTRSVPLLLTCLLSASSCAHAQQPAPSSDDPSGPTVLHVSTQLVLLDAIVAQRKTGQLQTTLTAPDFALSEDGVPQKVQYFTQDKLPLSIVLMFDLTDTVRPQLKDLAAGASDILAHFKPEDEVAVMTFSSATQLLQPFTTDHQAIAAAIQSASTPSTKDGTFLDEVLYEGAEQALKSTLPGTRRVLLFFTDGTATFVNARSRKFYGKNAPAQLHTRAEAQEGLLHTGVTVAALIDRSAADDAAIALIATNPLAYLTGLIPTLGDVQRLATATGGPVLHGGGHQVAAQLAALIEEIRGRYTLGYVPSAQRPPGTLCHITLTLTPAAYAAHPELKRDHYLVETRAAYYR